MVIDNLLKDGVYYTPAKAEGTSITLGVDGNSIVVDAAEYWGPEQSVVDVYTRGAGQPLTLDTAGSDSGIYTVATIVIPPQKSRMVEAGTQLNEQTGKEETVVKVETLPLDMDAVRVVRWPLPFEITAPEEKQKAEEEA